jgi:lysophospholipase L1-like esterase
MYLSLVLATLYCAQAADRKPFEFKDGDRIVWLGGTLVEREQRYGYWETALLAANPGKRITVRNLGWSGDTVHGEARGRFDFDKPDVCFKQLVDLTLQLKPTVIFISYGTNESFEGQEGLPKFEKGMEKLLDALKPANARIVLFAPLPFEKAPGLTDPKPMNEKLAMYRDAIKAIAEKRNHAFVDLIGRIKEFNLDFRWTANGMHLSEMGYLTTAAFLIYGEQTTPAHLGLWVGAWTDDQFAESMQKLRAAVIAKNELFFHRWRPQNETYLFGFRKHEQGKNAKEVAEFDPLVAKAEEEIERIRKTLTK